MADGQETDQIRDSREDAQQLQEANEIAVIEKENDVGKIRKKEKEKSLDTRPDVLPHSNVLTDLVAVVGKSDEEK